MHLFFYFYKIINSKSVVQAYLFSCPNLSFHTVRDISVKRLAYLLLAFALGDQGNPDVIRCDFK